MTANIYWEPFSRKAKNIPVTAPSRFMQELENAGLGTVTGGNGITLTEEHLPTLIGMKAVFSGVNNLNPYWHIINAIETHKEIRLWAVY